MKFGFDWKWACMTGTEPRTQQRVSLFWPFLPLWLNVPYKSLCFAFIRLQVLVANLWNFCYDASSIVCASCISSCSSFLLTCSKIDKWIREKREVFSCNRTYRIHVICFFTLGLDSWYQRFDRYIGHKGITARSNAPNNMAKSKRRRCSLSG
jgi:hypothetical protein